MFAVGRARHAEDEIRCLLFRFATQMQESDGNTPQMDLAYFYVLQMCVGL